MRTHYPWVIAISLWGLSGCAATPYQPGAPATMRLKARALASLKQGARYRHVPLVRCQAIEALRIAAPDQGRPWIRSGLLDENAGVRFAACMALGELRDATSRARITELLDDPDVNVRVAAIFALHRMGNTRHTHRLAEFLIYDKDPAVRRNAALALGRLGEPGAIKLLARVMNHPDEGLRLQALESMALLGAQEARDQLRFLAHSGLGARETFALNALGATRDPELAELYQYRLKSAAHPETRLAAARALGRLGIHDGYELAARDIAFNNPDRSPEIARDDPPQAQVVRVRTIAALALGAIGDPAALAKLAAALEEPYDPRVELAAALAILEILKRDAERVLQTN